MSEPAVAIQETDPPQKKSSKSGIIGLVVILVILWFVWASMRVPEAARMILDLDENAQQALVLTDGQGQGGLAVSDSATDLAKKSKEQEAAKPMGQKDVWYTFYPNLNDDEKIKMQIKDGSYGWTLKDATEGIYTWRNKYEVKLKAPMTSDNYPYGLMFYERNMSIGEKIGLVFRNLLP